jgi:hypothetical protein
MVALLAFALLAPPAGDAAQEEFLRYGEIVKVERLGRGVTGSRRATLRLHGEVHEAHVQTVNIQHRPLASFAHFEPGFTDSFKYNIAAYLLDRLIGLRMSPVCVFRQFEGQSASFCWWVDGVLMTEGERQARRVSPPDPVRHARQMWRLRVFDQLIYNMDRNQGNLLYDRQWRAWAIDHTRAFRVWPELRRPGDVTRADHALLEGLRGLTRAALEAHLGPWLTARQIDALLARRDLIVARIEERIQQEGRDQVVFDFEEP